MGLYDREYMREMNSKGRTPQIVITLSVIVSLVAATSYLFKEIRLFSKTHRKAAVVEPSRHEKLLAISPIDLNIASRDNLRLLPHVSEQMVTEIMAQRPLHTIDQLEDVHGIGEKKLAAIRPHVYVDQESINREYPGNSSQENAELDE